ncbi:MAG: bifunctional nuclease family protein [Nitrosopumilus sp.]|jgi:hypothetical protein|nr:bifunctional nuclease family protein [Nitrosopumilus sp.]
MKFINYLNKIKKYLRPNDDFEIKQEISNDEIQVKIDQIGTDSFGLQGVLILKTDDGKEFPISAFSGEVARYIAGFRDGQRDTIPTIYNLIEQLSEESELFLVKVKIFDSGNALRANLYFSGRKNIILRNFRASDAIALAAYYGVPIIMSKNLFEQQAKELS